MPLEVVTHWWKMDEDWNRVGDASTMLLSAALPAQVVEEKTTVPVSMVAAALATGYQHFMSRSKMPGPGQRITSVSNASMLNFSPVISCGCINYPVISSNIEHKQEGRCQHLSVASMFVHWKRMKKVFKPPSQQVSCRADLIHFGDETTATFINFQDSLYVFKSMTVGPTAIPFSGACRSNSRKPTWIRGKFENMFDLRSGVCVNGASKTSRHFEWDKQAKKRSLYTTFLKLVFSNLGL